MKPLAILCTTLAMLTASAATAAPPELKTLLPSGAQRGQTVEVTISGKLGTAPVRAWCSRPGVTVTVPEKGTKFTVQVANDAEPGVCWIRLTNAEGASALRPFVIGTLPEVADAEPNNELAKAQLLPSSKVVVNGALAKGGDVDAFAVTLEKGQSLVASVDAHELLGSPMDAILQIVSPQRFVLEQNDDARGFDPLVAFTATETGTHFVRIFAFPSTPNSSIGLAGGASYIYRLTLTTGPFVDHALPLSLKRGEQQTVELQGWNLGESLRQLPVAASSEADRAVLRHAELANTIDLRIDDHAAQAEQEPNSPDKPNEITLPVAVAGRIDPPGDEDLFAFNAKKGERLAFRLESRSLGQPLDAVLDVRNAEGKSLKRVDDPKRNEFDPVLDFTVPSDGRYLISVTDLFGHGGLRYAYCLTAGPLQPDFELSVESDTFKLTAGTPLKIPVTVTRENGFAGAIEISVAGLPEGVTAAVVVSSAEKKTDAKAELELTAAAETVIDGDFRIMGTPAAEAGLRLKAAAAPIAGLTQKTRDLWLTVVKK